MLYLRDATYIDSVDFTITATHLAVEQGPLGAVSFVAGVPPASELGPEDSVFDCKGRFVTRALACGHHHIYSALSRGMPPAPRVPTTFAEVLEFVWWRLDKCLDKDMTAASALVTGLHLAKNGVTFCIDHHAAPFAVQGSLSVIADCLDRIGIGHLLCHETSDRDGPDAAWNSLEEHDRYLASGGKGHIGLHASFTVSDETLTAAVALAENHDTGIHIHVAEARSDQEHCLATRGKTVVRRLKDAGALDMPKTILGHCVHISEEDKRILAASPCWVVQNVESNLNNNVGLGEYSYSNNVMLGTDGMHSDMLRSARSAYLNGQALEGLTCTGAYARLRNAHLHSTLHGPCGDGENNLVILNYDSPTPLHQANATGHFFYGLAASHVDSVISQGKIVVEKGILISCDEEEILSFAREQAQRLWKRLG